MNMGKKQSKRFWVFSLILLCLISCISSQAIAGGKDPNNKEDLFKMSLEELMEVPVITSASRQPQKMGQSSAFVSVITAEDIHYSGLTNIAEILQFVPDVDVRKFSRRRYGVGVRGLASRVSDRTLVLINGRYANNPFFGSPDWSGLPVLMEDIERIEVVHGPGGAAWGANALTGVINIITKKPKDVLGGFASTTISQFGDSYTHLRVAEKKDAWSWRISAGYEDAKDSDQAGAGKYVSGAGVRPLNGLMGFDSYSAKDWIRNWRFDSEAEYQVSEETKLSFGVGHSNSEGGASEFVGYLPEKDDMTSLTRAFMRIDHIFDNGTTGYLQWYGNFLRNHMPNVIEKYFTYENHLEGQLNFTLADRHNISVGGDISWLQAGVTYGDNGANANFSKEPYEELGGGLFFIDSFEVTDRLTLEGQIRTDFHSENDRDWSTRLSAIYALDEAKKHSLRFSVARAFRAPGIAIRTQTMSSVSGFINILPLEEKLRNENSWSFEAGYTGKLTKNLTFSTNAYYQRFEDVIATSEKTNIFGISNSVFKNIDGATNVGFESELALADSRGKLSVWYAYDHFVTDQHRQFLRALPPAMSKAGLTGRLFLPDGWTFNANCVVNSSIRPTGESLILAPSFNRIDLTLSKTFAKGKGEFMIGVSDVMNKTNKAITDIGDLTGHETPGRTLFARVQMRF